MRAQSPSIGCILYAVCPFCQVYRPITAMEFDRNLRFTIDLNDFPKFSRVRLWTLGISENAGMIRARSDSEWYPKKGVFEPCLFARASSFCSYGRTPPKGTSCRLSEGARACSILRKRGPKRDIRDPGTAAGQTALGRPKHTRGEGTWNLPWRNVRVEGSDGIVPKRKIPT